MVHATRKKEDGSEIRGNINWTWGMKKKREIKYKLCICTFPVCLHKTDGLK
jgi:hypothetical protein